MVFDRPAHLIDEVHAELQEVRIRLAQLRDDLLTRDEMAVMLEVYEEFDR